MMRLILTLTLVVAIPSALRGAIYVEMEDVGGTTNNSIGTAEAINFAILTLPVPPTVFDPPGWATATIEGTGGIDVGAAESDVDFFSFTTAGGGAMFDIDDYPFTFDTILSLFDSSGTLIASGEDSFPEDSGTAFGFDSFIGVISLPAGTYFITVSQFANFANAFSSASGFTSLSRPDGEPGGFAVIGATLGDSSFFESGPDGSLEYELNVSLENMDRDGGGNVGSVPEPISVVVWTLLGVIAVGATKWRAPRRQERC